MNRFMDGFSLRAEIIIPILLMILSVIVKIIWSRFSKLSVKRALDKKESFEEFIQEVIISNNSKRFNNDLDRYLGESHYKTMCLLKALNNSKLTIAFKLKDDNLPPEFRWNANYKTKINQFVYFLSLSESERNDYKGA
ncbi:hypothetical protein WZ78_09020 [Leuconostoc mesenteroides subsp. dextranicum]|uniref:hypothetical protein n=1 Tax=Leuconostoc mesenteroides TaxID=1245 RepID=UPI00068115BC|nr:hypothetical protein [Leuconostoc mesenteroides]KMY80812.1 hypothetical protein WZ78_09020 [Leuconostoc mesenteroides subsp. dextranicum]